MKTIISITRIILFCIILYLPIYGFIIVSDDNLEEVNGFGLQLMAVITFGLCFLLIGYYLIISIGFILIAIFSFFVMVITEDAKKVKEYVNETWLYMIRQIAKFLGFFIFEIPNWLFVREFNK